MGHWLLNAKCFVIETAIQKTKRIRLRGGAFNAIGYCPIHSHRNGIEFLFELVLQDVSFPFIAKHLPMFRTLFDRTAFSWFHVPRFVCASFYN